MKKKKKIEPNCEHKERPVRSRGLCGSCYNKYLFDRHSPERKNLIYKQRRLNAKNKRERSDKKEWAKQQRNRILKYRYGISQQDYDLLFNAQDGKCAICKQEWVAKHPLYVDHNHTTGQARGLLCARCNLNVGLVEKGEIDKVNNYLNNACARLELILKEENNAKTI